MYSLANKTREKGLPSLIIGETLRMSMTVGHGHVGQGRERFLNELDHYSIHL